MSELHRWVPWGGLALVAALCISPLKVGAALPIMGLGEKEDESEQIIEQEVLVDSVDDALKQLMLFVPFRDKSKYKGEWDIYSELPRGLTDSLRGSAFFSTIPIDSALVRMKKKELKGKFGPDRALEVGRAVAGVAGDAAYRAVGRCEAAM